MAATREDVVFLLLQSMARQFVDLYAQLLARG
jgi:hypothetical protein